jgi:uncharacterized protein (TIGR02118 family)
MFNLALLAARPPEWTHDEFITWWRGEHAEVTYPLPGLRAWRHTAVSSALEPRSEGWDGLSVLSFDDETAARAALASKEWQAAITHVGPCAAGGSPCSGTSARCSVPEGSSR